MAAVVVVEEEDADIWCAVAAAVVVTGTDWGTCDVHVVTVG